jgi:hypothetical protein
VILSVKELIRVRACYGFLRLRCGRKIRGNASKNIYCKYFVIWQKSNLQASINKVVRIFMKLLTLDNACKQSLSSLNRNFLRNGNAQTSLAFLALLKRNVHLSSSDRARQYHLKVKQTLSPASSGIFDFV